MGKKGPKPKRNSRTQVVGIAVEPELFDMIVKYTENRGGTVSSAMYPILKDAVISAVANEPGMYSTWPNAKPEEAKGGENDLKQA